MRMTLPLLVVRRAFFDAVAPGRRDKTCEFFAIPATRRLGVETRKRKTLFS